VRSILLAAVLVLVSLPAAAQPAGQFQFDVPLRWTQAEGESTDRQHDVAATLGLEHLIAGERVRLFYDLDVDAFGTQESLRTWLHNAGAIGTWGSARRAFDLGGAVFWRANEGAWSDAGFKGVNLLTSFRLQPRQGLTLATSYALYARTFADEPALDQREHFGSFRVLANLATRTTVIGVLSLGHKNYDGRAVTTVYEEASYGQASHGGRGWGMGMFAPAEVEVTGAPGSRRQWTWAARVAQSLDDRTGVWLEREERRTGGELPPAIVWTPPMFYEDGVYDDPYVIDAKSWRASARHVFAGGHEISAWGSRADRAYAGLVRADVLIRAAAEGVAPLTERANASFDLVARYAFFRNESSDALQSYQAHQVSIGLRLGF